MNIIVIGKSSEYIDSVPPLEPEIVVNSQDEHEGGEGTSSSKEVPNVVSVKEIQQDTFLIFKSKQIRIFYRFTSKKLTSLSVCFGVSG